MKGNWEGELKPSLRLEDTAVHDIVILSAAKDLLFRGPRGKQIPRFARNDNQRVRVSKQSKATA